jgi:hypothetical protein
MPFSKKELGESGYQLYQSMFESMESRGRNPPNIAVFTPTTALQLPSVVYPQQPPAWPPFLSKAEQRPLFKYIFLELFFYNFTYTSPTSY